MSPQEINEALKIIAERAIRPIIGGDGSAYYMRYIDAETGEPALRNLSYDEVFLE